MKSHNGMRPQDIVILLKIIALRDKKWQYRDLASHLFISISEISESLNRSTIAGLYDSNLKKIRRNTLLEFLQYGLPCVFPQIPGSLVTGIRTAHSHPFYKNQFISSENMVWPFPDGDSRGQAIEPLHKGVPQAVQKDELLYLLLASVDILRVGRIRERTIATKELKKYLL